jgi:multiple sugar transport system substrate-binding protein
VLSAAGGSAAFIGPSAESYRYRGTDWGLPIDAACQVAAYRPTLLARLDRSVPKTWEEVCDLGSHCATHNQSIVVALRGVHSLMTFFSLCANLGSPFATEAGESRIDAAAASEALAQMRRLVELCRAPVLDFNSIDVQEALSTSDKLVYCPAVYGFAAYGEADRDRRLAFGPFPGAASPDADAGSTIGGAGLGVSARVADDPEKADAAFAYLRFAARAASQKDIFAHHHGQPAHVDVWNDPGIDARFGGFFSATRGTIERSWIRPRYDGYLSFQTRAGNLIEAHLRGNLSERRLLDSLKALDAECRPAMSR